LSAFSCAAFTSSTEGEAGVAGVGATSFAQTNQWLMPAGLPLEFSGECSFGEVHSGLLPAVPVAGLPVVPGL
jgi:hypothetical protein